MRNVLKMTSNLNGKTALQNQFTLVSDFIRTSMKFLNTWEHYIFSNDNDYVILCSHPPAVRLLPLTAGQDVYLKQPWLKPLYPKNVLYLENIPPPTSPAYAASPSVSQVDSSWCSVCLLPLAAGFSLIPLSRNICRPWYLSPGRYCACPQLILRFWGVIEVLYAYIITQL